MSILVKNDKTEKKIYRFARRTGETITAAIDRALRTGSPSSGRSDGIRGGWIARGSRSYSPISILCPRRTST